MHFNQVVTRAEGRLHSLTLRDVLMTEAGEVKLTAKDFVTQAKLTVNGENTVLLHPCIVYIRFPILFFRCWFCLLRGGLLL